MDNKMFNLFGKLVVVAFTKKDGNPCRALAVDTGYTLKMLTFKTADIAEILGVGVREFVENTPVPSDGRAVYVVGE